MMPENGLSDNPPKREDHQKLASFGKRIRTQKMRGDMARNG
jgi:hypothetical protein